MKKQRILEAVLFVPVFLFFGGIFVWYFLSAFFMGRKDQIDMDEFKQLMHCRRATLRQHERKCGVMWNFTIKFKKK